MDVQAWIDQQEAHNTEIIRQRGWVIHYVGGDSCSRPDCPHPPDDEPPFAYTTGLFGLGHPELLIVGVPPETAALVLNTLGERVRRGERLMPGHRVEVAGWSRRIVPEPVSNAGEILLWSNGFYHRPAEHSVPALQLTYADAGGRFPWEAGFAEPHLQPRPGTFNA
jgi:hypothetical protein